MGTAKRWEGVHQKSYQLTSEDLWLIAYSPFRHLLRKCHLPRKQGRRNEVLSLLAILLLAFPLAAHADPLADQRRAEALYTEVRCVQCQSESIADSNAQIAADMRTLIREEIKQGLTDAQIRKTLSDHYGDYVLFRPRLSKSNLLLWFLPLLIIVLGGAGLWVASKKTAKSNDYALSKADQEKLDELMRPRD